MTLGQNNTVTRWYLAMATFALNFGLVGNVTAEEEDGDTVRVVQEKIFGSC